MYEQLLKLENYELSKKPTISWERIMEIRHLKDRMIRKCQKLAKTAMPMAKKSSRGDTFVFQTFVAPADFRCKEMEKWFREQQKRAASVPRRTVTSGGQELTLVAGPSRHPSTSSKHTMQRSVTNPEASSSKQRPAILYKPSPAIQPHRLMQSTAPLPVPAGLNEVMSPPPLPVLLLSVREELGFDEQPPNMATLTLSLEQTADAANQPLPEATPRPTLSRRPSCIKRNSTGDLKTVSWADGPQDLDNQLLKYASAARDAQTSGERANLSAYLFRSPDSILLYFFTANHIYLQANGRRFACYI